MRPTPTSLPTRCLRVAATLLLASVCLHVAAMLLTAVWVKLLVIFVLILLIPAVRRLVCWMLELRYW